ncbi:uncharacterized protein JN550_000480 [Neoarthrinium moseri]|uniref:uncharacterized protein n=1 Tax=Neoarthrinium moseri TaxID=1658444 RepID=UPI001FDBC2BD|nr:uncharacterized protein JN550_000480 [Neoarthrinium moseri]KAI1878298.1 hypothetical protein JN550_000480 [Neoarthrinium moseri]
METTGLKSVPSLTLRATSRPDDRTNQVSQSPQDLASCGAALHLEDSSASTHKDVGEPQFSHRTSTSPISHSAPPRAPRLGSVPYDRMASLLEVDHFRLPSPETDTSRRSTGDTSITEPFDSSPVLSIKPFRPQSPVQSRKRKIPYSARAARAAHKAARVGSKENSVRVPRRMSPANTTQLQSPISVDGDMSRVWQDLDGNKTIGDVESDTDAQPRKIAHIKNGVVDIEFSNDESMDCEGKESPSDSSPQTREIRETRELRIPSGWTPINRDRNVAWESSTASSGAINPFKEKVSRKKPDRVGGGIVWSTLIDPLWRHDASLNMLAGRRKKAQARAEERQRMLDLARVQGLPVAKKRRVEPSPASKRKRDAVGGSEATTESDEGHIMPMECDY